MCELFSTQRIVLFNWYNISFFSYLPVKTFLCHNKTVKSKPDVTYRFYRYPDPALKEEVATSLLFIKVISDWIFESFITFFWHSNFCCFLFMKIYITSFIEAVAHRIRAFAMQAESWVFKSQPWQTYVVKTGSDSSTAKPSAIGVSVTGSPSWHL